MTLPPLLKMIWPWMYWFSWSTLNFIPPICMLVLRPVLHWLVYCSFVESLKSRSMCPTTKFFIRLFSLFGHLALPYEFWGQLVCQKSSWNSDRVCFGSVGQFGKYNHFTILTILVPPIYEHRISVHLSKLSIIYFHTFLFVFCFGVQVLHILG